MKRNVTITTTKGVRHIKYKMSTARQRTSEPKNTCMSTRLFQYK